jgi:hypothetical protein
MTMIVAMMVVAVTTVIVTAVLMTVTVGIDARSVDLSGVHPQGSPRGSSAVCIDRAVSVTMCGHSARA